MVEKDIKKEQILSNGDEAPSQKDNVTAPIKTIQDKWKLVETFLQCKGLVKQHIDSYNHFINNE
ncbi:DNA-directed RNA polymerase III subunit RPC2, partial [Paramuricea clavata]